jgi:glycosyltransferase involved in cell wall biosynthesis
MRIGFVMENEPRLDSGGGGIVTWTLLRYLVDAGHHVTAYLLGASEAAARSHERDLGAEVVPVRVDAPTRDAASRVLTRLASPVASLYPGLHAGVALRQALSARQHDAMCLWDFVPGMLLARHRDAPALLLYGDPAFRVRWVQWLWKMFPPRLAPHYLRDALLSPLYLRDIVSLRRAAVVTGRAYESFGSVSAHEAAWYRTAGIAGARYYPPPIHDFGTKHHVPAPAPKAKLLMASALDSTSSLRTLPLLLEIVKRLERRLGVDAFELHLVGRGSLTGDLAGEFARPTVRVRGYVENLEAEFPTAHVVLAPIPLKIGNRVRIITAFSFGSCVVAHRYTALGNPALEDGVNVLLGTTADELADHIVRVLREPDLRQRLGRAARVTYQAQFAPDRAAATIEAELNRIAVGAGAVGNAAGAASVVGREARQSGMR